LVTFALERVVALKELVRELGLYVRRVLVVLAAFVSLPFGRHYNSIKA